MGRGLAMSPSQGRLSPERMERPVSPTKGLGGFVQSAMMKRSDSVNKRWSAQAPSGLSRGNSVASSHSGFEGPKFASTGIAALGEAKPTRFSRESTPSSSSPRPGSNHSNATVTPNQTEGEGSTDSKPLRDLRSTTPPNRGISQPAPSKEESSSPGSTAGSKPSGVMSPPMSPSKRWSPQKSSWLENAINKPESPKPLSPAKPPQQPSWMADIARSKQQRGSVDSSKGPNHRQIATGGLLRSPPPGTGYKPPNISGLPPGFSASVATKPRAGSTDRAEKPDDVPNPVAGNDALESNDSAHAPSPEINSYPDQPNTAPSSMASQVNTAKNQNPTAHPVRSPRSIAAKPKPETPPKKDFKSSLKPRPALDENPAKDEPEFKNVFGKLKRTQTQNYKASDELKDNIMRGKSGLAVTGGPKRTERKDEFKESILNKKQGMVAPSASTKITGASFKNTETPTPEAIKKRQGLTRSDSLVSNGSVETARKADASKPEPLDKLQGLRDKPQPAASEKPKLDPGLTQKKSNANLGGNFASSLAGILQRGPSPVSATSSKVEAPSMSGFPKAPPREPVPQADTPLGGPQLTHATRGRARGPKRKLPAANQHSAADESPSKIVQPPATELSESKPSSSIDASRAQTSTPSPLKTEARPLSNITNSNNNNRKSSQPSSPRKPSTSITLPPKSTPASTKPLAGEVSTKTTPVVKAKPASPVMDKVRKPSMPGLQSSEHSPPKDQDGGERRQPPPNAAASPDEIAPLPSVKNAAALWGHPAQPSQPASPRSPVKLPIRKDEEAAAEGGGAGAIKTDSLGLDISAARLAKSPKMSTAPPSASSPKSPPLPGKKPKSIIDKTTSNSLTSPVKPLKVSPGSRPSDAVQLFAEVFDEPLSSKGNIKIDTQAVLDARSSPESFPKIKTLRKQIFELGDHGKTHPVPSHQEHILFEQSLYLCTHVFGTPAGQRTTEVYLWCGDGVSTSAVEDAQLFARKVAKDNGGKLIVLQQGKETSNFFQALGGIVIIRRGGSDGPGSATYMLCGRQHVGQIAFDEVDFDPQSLCSGFPFILSARFGKLFLWKGRGAGADELGCARLIGMDLGLTGEIEEVDEGKEPDEFWASFPGSAPKRAPAGSPAKHWHLKASCEKHAIRLFSIDTEPPRPKSASSFIQWGRRGSAPSNDVHATMTSQIREVTPFSLADIVDDNIFVLDAFFEIFV